MVHAVDATVADLADRLWRAESERVAIPPLTAGLPDMTIDDAYAVQTCNIDRRVAAGAVIRGRKAGLTSRPVQDLLGVHEPNFGVLLDDRGALRMRRPGRISGNEVRGRRCPT